MDLNPLQTQRSTFTLNTATHAHVYPKCTPIAAMLSTLQQPEAGSRLVQMKWAGSLSYPIAVEFTEAG